MYKKLLLVASMLAATPAYAEKGEWWQAESDHFKVISAGTEENAREMAVSLERLDQAMRMFRGLPVGDEVPDSIKATIYQFGETSDIGRLINSSSVAGFFIPRAGNSVAFVPLKENDNSRGRVGVRVKDKRALTPGAVIFHEYAHYFMRQHAPAAYPFWYQEGFAELFGTLELREDGFNIGEPPKYRSDILQELSFDVEKILNMKFGDTVSSLDVMRQYAYGWMFTSYLSFEPSRQGQLANYLRLMNAGKSNLDAAREAFGDLGALQKDLEKYHRGRARALAVTFAETKTPDVEVSRLSPDTADQMLMHIQSTAGVTETKAKGQVGEARQLVSKYPQSLPVLLSATEVEFDAKNFDQAEALANRAITVDPQGGHARLYLAKIAMERARTDPAQLAVARKYFVEANRIDSTQPEALMGYYLTYAMGSETPPEDALIALESAYKYAPFDDDIQITLAHLLLTENRDKEALILLGPIIYSPHSNKKIDKIRELVEKINAGDRAPLIEELRPKFKDRKEEEDS